MQPEPDNLRNNPFEPGQTERSFSQLPADMLVAIEGAPHAKCRPVGEQVAQTLGAILVDSERYYRSMKLSCIEARVDLDDYEAVSIHCASAHVEMWVRNQGGLFDEALAFVNSDLFKDSELSSMQDDSPRMSLEVVSQNVVKWALHEIPKNRRKVILGCNLDKRLFYSTPFRFHIKAKMMNENQPPAPKLTVPSDFLYHDPNRKGADEAIDALRIDGDVLGSAQVCEKILSELVPQHIREMEYQRRKAEDPFWKSLNEISGRKLPFEE